MTFTIRQPIIIAEFNGTNAKEPEKFETTIKAISLAVQNKIKLQVWDTIGSFFERIEAIEKRQLKLFKEPEFQHNPPSGDKSRAYTEVSLTTNSEYWKKPPTANIKLTFDLPINNLDSDEKTHEVIDMIKMMDQSFESLRSQILKSSEEVMNPYMQKYFNV
jgi:hypothetical protein